MIIILTGPTGSGKTDTSWELLKLFNEIVFLDCDWFASSAPFAWEKESDVHMVYQAISTMISFYHTHNYKNFVITLTPEMAHLYFTFNSYFTQFKLPIHAFRLKCDYIEHIRRISQRDRIESQKNRELIAAEKHSQFFDNSFPDNKIFQIIDSTNLSEPQVALEIKKRIIKN